MPIQLPLCCCAQGSSKPSQPSCLPPRLPLPLLPPSSACSCPYQEDADPSDWCVYRNEVHHTSREKSVVLQVRSGCCWSRQATVLLASGGGAAAERLVASAALAVSSRLLCICWEAVAPLELLCRSTHRLPPCPLPSPPPLEQDVRSDPTLPRTRDVRCPICQNNEAVFFTASTEEGMTLFLNCCNCGHRWRDYV